MIIRGVLGVQPQTFTICFAEVLVIPKNYKPSPIRMIKDRDNKLGTICMFFAFARDLVCEIMNDNETNVVTLECIR